MHHPRPDARTRAVGTAAPAAAPAAARAARTTEPNDSAECERTRMLPSGGELALGVALGCNMAWVSMCFKSMNVYVGAAHAEALLDAVYLVSIVTVTLTLALAGVLYRRVEPLIGAGWAAWALPLCMAASTLLMPLGAAGGGVGSAGILAAGVLSGVFSGLYLLRLGMAICRVELRSCVVAAASGTIFSTLAFVLFLLFEPFEAAVFAASMPIASSLLLEYGRRAVPAIDNEEDAEADDQPDTAAARRDRITLVAKLMLCSLLIGFANEAGRTLYMQMGIADAGSTAYALVQGVTAFGMTAGVVALALILVNTATERQARNCYHALVLMLVGGALLLPVTSIYDGQTVYLPYALNDAAYSCFGMFMWVLLASVCARQPRTQLRTFALVRAGWALGPLLGILLGRAVLRLTPMGTEQLFGVSVLLVLAILLASGFVFSENDLVRALDIMPFERKRRFQAKCQKVIDRYGLSEREGEIMVMLAKGRNLPYVQEQLYLSKSTISTHRQHIYQKLDIHSQQELINLVQEI